MAFEVFISYSHQDQQLRQELDTHLANLKRQHLISSWYDGDIAPGTELEPQILAHLNSAQIILLLISADFMDSDFCSSIEMTQAIARHDADQVRVIPIIVRPTDWKGAPFAKLKLLPTDGKAVTSWPTHDDAFEDIVQGIRDAIDDLIKKGAGSSIASGTTSMGAAKVPLWTIPYERNVLFTGREDVLQRLSTALRAGKTTALAQPQAISGLGGIGKTQTAVEYAYRYQDDYDAVLWLRAESREALLSDFVTLARLLQLPEQQEPDQQQLIAAVKRWFHDHTRWLLIFDNADDLTMVRDFLPARGNGHLLLTTRSQVTGRLAQRIEVERLDQEEGMLFLLHRATILEQDAPLAVASQADRLAARDIVQAMDGLPLALDQAGAFLEETGCNLSDYLQLYQTRQADLIKRRGTLAVEHPDPVATTWSLSFEKLQQANPAAADLLRQCAFLDADAIPEEIFSTGAAELGSVLEPVAADPLRLNEAIGALLTYSFVHRTAQHTLTVHRLVQAVLRHSMNKSTQRRWAERAVRAVDQAFPEVDYDSWLHCQQYLPQVQMCKALIEEWKMTFPAATHVLTQAAGYLYDSAQYAQAEPLYLQAIAIGEKVLGPEHPDLATWFNNLATLYLAQGQYAQAEPLYRRAIAIDEKVLGPEHPGLATHLNNLATLYLAQGQYAQAEPLYQRAIAIGEKVLGPEHPDLATWLNNLATLYSDQGNYEQAEPLYQRAIANVEKVSGPEHPNLAGGLNNLATLYSDQGNYEQAEPLYQRAIAIDEKVLGPEHPGLATDLNNLAELYREQGKYAQAEPLFQRAIAIDEKVFGPTHPNLARDLNNLALLYKTQGKYEQAEPLYLRALAIYERAFGPTHPHTTLIRENYTALLEQMKQKGNPAQSEDEA